MTSDPPPPPANPRSSCGNPVPQLLGVGVDVRKGVLPACQRACIQKQGGGHTVSQSGPCSPSSHLSHWGPPKAKGTRDHTTPSHHPPFSTSISDPKPGKSSPTPPLQTASPSIVFRGATAAWLQRAYVIVAIPASHRCTHPKKTARMRLTSSQRPTQGPALKPLAPPSQFP